MKEENHEFQISAQELDYLIQMPTTDDSLANLFRNEKSKVGTNFVIRLSRDDSEKLRACLTEHLAKIGFEKDYSLTEQGKVLEELIDRLYVP